MPRRLHLPGALAGASISALLCVTARAQPAPAPAPVATSSPAPGAAADDEADQLFSRGNDAFDRGDLDEAYALYKKAWALKRTYDIAGNLGQVELKLGKFRDAAEHLDFTLRLFPPTGKSEPREAIRRALDAARNEVGALSITVNVRGASVAIDGQPVGLSPFDAPVFVEPGKRTVEATLEAHLPTRITIDIGKNEVRDIALSLTPKSQPPPPPRNVPLLITGFGLGLAAAGTGIGLMIPATNKGSDADALLAQLVASEPDGKCPCGSEPQRARLKGMRQDHDLFFNVAVGTFVGAGVLAAGSAAYALTPWFQRPHTSPSARVLPMVSHQGGGALLVGSF